MKSDKEYVLRTVILTSFAKLCLIFTTFMQTLIIKPNLIMKALLTIFSLLFISLFSVSLTVQNSANGKTNSAARVIELIIKSTGSALVPNKEEFLILHLTC